MISFACFRCGQEVVRTTRDPIGRSESCPHCKTDLRVCKNCRHYEASARWECRESIAEAVREKERGNFCDSFQPRGEGAALPLGFKPTPSRDDLLRAAEALFKKK